MTREQVVKNIVAGGEEQPRTEEEQTAGFSAREKADSSEYRASAASCIARAANAHNSRKKSQGG